MCHSPPHLKHITVLHSQVALLENIPGFATALPQSGRGHHFKFLFLPTLTSSLIVLNFSITFFEQNRWMFTGVNTCVHWNCIQGSRIAFPSFIFVCKWSLLQLRQNLCPHASAKKSSLLYYKKQLSQNSPTSTGSTSMSISSLVSGSITLLLCVNTSYPSLNSSPYSDWLNLFS